MDKNEIRLRCYQEAEALLRCKPDNTLEKIIETAKLIEKYIANPESSTG